ncbi:hypothetical protein [Brevibacillus dissolubilis]|uniref:hypothetical protein n=1 Tax=Brevibacillus dissolubilis TaxID=1844116 RepID=UPI0011165F2C|nr:hypothetical protein [Brevibacillus dissolubilis]
MPGLRGLRYHFEGVRGKVVQIRELVEVLDTMFDSFYRVNRISRTMVNGNRDLIDEVDEDY